MFAEIEQMCQSFSFLSEEYQQRLAESKKVNPTLCNWLLEAVLSRSNELKQKASSIVEDNKYANQRII